MKKGNKLVMDINALPTEAMNITGEQWQRIIEEDNLVLYDSTKGDKPFFMEEEDTIEIVDINSDKGKKLLYCGIPQKIVEEIEKVRRMFYNSQKHKIAKEIIVLGHHSKQLAFMYFNDITSIQNTLHVSYEEDKGDARKYRWELDNRKTFLEVLAETMKPQELKEGNFELPKMQIEDVWPKELEVVDGDYKAVEKFILDILTRARPGEAANLHGYVGEEAMIIFHRNMERWKENSDFVGDWILSRIDPMLGPHQQRQKVLYRFANGRTITLIHSEKLNLNRTVSIYNTEQDEF